MESVEQMCDHIALINKSNKILDGKLSDIKRNYRTNSYEIGLETRDDSLVSLQNLEKILLPEMAAHWEVSPAFFKTINENDLKMIVKIPQDLKSRDLLFYLSDKATINHFVEVIPTVNDIFIQTINAD